jgi:hypothetical protein
MKGDSHYTNIYTNASTLMPRYGPSAINTTRWGAVVRGSVSVRPTLERDLARSA